MRDVDAENDIHAWDRRAVAWLLGVLSLAFTAWSGVVWSSGQSMVTELRAARMEDAQYRLVMERRLTILEQQQAIMQQRQGFVLEALREINGRVPP